MTDPRIDRAVFVQRTLARQHLARVVTRTRAELGLLEVAGVPVIRDRRVPVGHFHLETTGRVRDSRGRFVKAGAR